MKSLVIIKMVIIIINNSNNNNNNNNQSIIPSTDRTGQIGQFWNYKSKIRL